MSKRPRVRFFIILSINDLNSIATNLALGMSVNRPQDPLGTFQFFLNRRYPNLFIPRLSFDSTVNHLLHENEDQPTNTLGKIDCLRKQEKWSREIGPKDLSWWAFFARYALWTTNWNETMSRLLILFYSGISKAVPIYCCYARNIQNAMVRWLGKQKIQTFQRQF